MDRDERALDIAQSFDLRRGTWTEVARMGNRRVSAQAVLLLDDRVVTVGGVGESGAGLATAELYLPAGSP
jgi:hypothetical protein